MSSTETRLKLISFSNITDADVILGSTKIRHGHKGTRAYLDLVESLSKQYQTTSVHKMDFVAQEVVAPIRAKGGRFLRFLTKVKSKKEPHAYFEVTDERKIIKTIQERFRSQKKLTAEKQKAESEEEEEDFTGEEGSHDEIEYLLNNISEGIQTLREDTQKKKRRLDVLENRLSEALGYI